MIVPFGKYKGVEIDQLPTPYLVWLCEAEHDALLEPFGGECRRELAERRATEGNTRLAANGGMVMAANVVPIRRPRGGPRKVRSSGGPKSKEHTYAQRSKVSLLCAQEIIKAGLTELVCKYERGLDGSESKVVKQLREAADWLTEKVKELD